MTKQGVSFSPFGWVKAHKLISLTAVMVIIIVGYFTYQAVALRINKHDFQQARTAIDATYTDIVAQVGQPDNYKRSSTCGKTYQEFRGYGDTTCDVDSDFIYGVSNESAANDKLKQIQSILAKHGSSFMPAKPLSSSISDTLVVNTTYHTASDNYKTSGLDCAVNYIYDTPREIFLQVNDKSKKPFQITIGCYGPARQQYYPLAG